MLIPEGTSRVYPLWERTALGIISTRTDQCFGHWSGWMSADDGERVRVDGVVGWAEDVRNRW